MFTRASHFRILSQIYPIRSFLSYFSKINSNIFLPFIPRPSEWLFSFRCEFVMFLMRVTCPANLIPFDFITLKYLVERTSYEAPHYVFSSPMQFPPSQVQKFSSLPWSEVRTVLLKCHVVCYRDTELCAVNLKPFLLVLMIVKQPVIKKNGSHASWFGTKILMNTSETLLFGVPYKSVHIPQHSET